MGRALSRPRSALSLAKLNRITDIHIFSKIYTAESREWGPQAALHGPQTRPISRPGTNRRYEHRTRHAP